MNNVIENPEGRLRQLVNDIPILDVDTGSGTTRFWNKYANKLRSILLERDPQEMLDFWVLHHTMYTMARPEWAAMYVEYLRGRPDWEDRWFKAIKDPGFGHPTPLALLPHTSHTIVNHAYTLAQFEAATGLRVQNLPRVFEFGGGYGAMARLIHNLGFNGDYYDYDLPVFAALTEYYLNATGSHNVSCISDLELLPDDDNALFLSTCALSEASRELRMEVLAHIINYKYFLITYQPKFKEIDNERFFGRLRKRASNVNWQTWEIKNVGHIGLIGVRND